MSIAFVQANSNAGSFGTSTVITIMGTTAGNALFVWAAGPSAGTAYSISDGTNTYTTAIPYYSNTLGGIQSQGWVTTGIGGGSYTITVSFPTGSGVVDLVVYEISGLNATPVDQNSNTSGQYGATMSTGPVTTTAASEILLGCGFSITNAVTLTAGSGYTIPANGSLSTGTRAIAVEYQIVSSTGAYSATMTESSNNLWTMSMATLKGAGVVSVKHFLPLLGVGK